MFKHDRATTDDPFLALCLALYREAKAETDLDFAYFRYWNLLEVIASDRIAPGADVTDFKGAITGRQKEGYNTECPETRV